MLSKDDSRSKAKQSKAEIVYTFLLGDTIIAKRTYNAFSMSTELVLHLGNGSISIDRKPYDRKLPREVWREMIPVI